MVTNLRAAVLRVRERSCRSNRDRNGPRGIDRRRDGVIYLGRAVDA
jgi:hypothetical protein